MNLKKIDFFNPLIIVVAILVFLAMGYIGSFDYRFEDPLKPSVFIVIILACIVFGTTFLLTNRKVSVEKTKKIDILSEKLLVGLVIVALILQAANLVLMGGIPLFNSVLKSNATTNIWRIAYPLFLIMINMMMNCYLA